MFDIQRGKESHRKVVIYICVCISFSLNSGVYFLFDKQHKSHPAVKVVQSRGTKGKGREGGQEEEEEGCLLPRKQQ